MKVILVENVDKLGVAGDIVDVKRGYAQNYLFKQGLAMPKTPENLNIVKTRKKAFEAKAAQALADAEALAKELDQKVLEMPVKAGEGERLYGAITVGDIAQKIREEGFEVEKRLIKLGEPIKTLGEHKVELRLHPQVKTEVIIKPTRIEE
ncbi:MAG: 50S ribosomal protein L9 [Eubacteriales bacterium]|nr:50S ribosomal protein L9 [Eubacteriales bacterium]